MTRTVPTTDTGIRATPAAASRRSDLVVVYHRQPYEEVENPDGSLTIRENSSPNGIVPTLKGIMGRMERAAWIAWKEADNPDDPDFEPTIDIHDSHGDYSVTRLALTPYQVSSFYHQTSKEAFWPILHGFKERYNYDPVDWPTFREVNERFARAAAEAASENAVVWIHDYNLWLVPGYLRRLRPDVKIAFFHHTPFPGADMFNVLPWREEIVRSLLECDSVGFHIPRYTQNFVAAARSLTSARVVSDEPTDEAMTPSGAALSERWTPTLMIHHDHHIRLETNPVGVNADYVDRLAGSPGVEAHVAEIHDWLGDSKLILSVSRTDYTKGNLEQLAAFARLLDRRRDLRGKVRLMLASVSANRGMSAYDEVQQAIEAEAGRINGAHGTFEWQPVSLMSNPLSLDDLVAYYRAADVCSITPLADGLNLVAPEFCVAKRDHEDGALILSEFAGSSVLLNGEIPVNPFSHSSMDRALDHALAMQDGERGYRMQALRDSARRWDIRAWATATITLFRELVDPVPRDPAAVPFSRDRTQEVPIVTAPAD